MSVPSPPSMVSAEVKSEKSLTSMLSLPAPAFMASLARLAAALPVIVSLPAPVSTVDVPEPAYTVSAPEPVVIATVVFPLLHP